jgi:hypothetical protein
MVKPLHRQTMLYYSVAAIMVLCLVLGWMHYTDANKVTEGFGKPSVNKRKPVKNLYNATMEMDSKLKVIKETVSELVDDLPKEFEQADINDLNKVKKDLKNKRIEEGLAGIIKIVTKLYDVADVKKDDKGKKKKKKKSDEEDDEEEEEAE